MQSNQGIQDKSNQDSYKVNKLEVSRQGANHARKVQGLCTEIDEKNPYDSGGKSMNELAMENLPLKEVDNIINNIKSKILHEQSPSTNEMVIAVNKTLSGCQRNKENISPNILYESKGVMHGSDGKA